MPARDVGDLIFIGLDILATAVSSTTNLITAQIGNVVTQQVIDPVAEWWQQIGFASRPSRPQSGKSAAQCVVLKRSDNDAIIAARDSTSAAIYGQLDYGETAVFSTDGKCVVFLRKDGSVTVQNGNASGVVKIDSSGNVTIGGSGAQALALGSALQQLITIMTTFVAGNAVSFGSPLSTSATAITQLQALTQVQTQNTKAS